MERSSLRWLLCVVLVAALRLPAFADGSHDRTQFGHEIVIGADEKATEATCFDCSIRVRGHVSGDVTAFGGSVVVDQDGEVGGDTTVFGGDLRLESGAKVSSVTIFGGKLRREASASVRGDVTTFGGGAALWIFIVFGMPFIVLGALIVLIVWIVRRLTRPAIPLAAAAQPISPTTRAEGFPHS